LEDYLELILNSPCFFTPSYFIFGTILNKLVSFHKNKKKNSFKNTTLFQITYGQVSQKLKKNHICLNNNNTNNIRHDLTFLNTKIQEK
jgi:hypothetical protein